MCHKPAQVDHTSRMSCDTIYLITYNGPDLFKNFKEFYINVTMTSLISELNSNLNSKIK